MTMSTVMKKMILLTLLATVPLTLHAAGNPAAGQEKAKVCVACHGATGIGVDPNYPKLAGQHESYLVKALVDYRSGERSNLIMSGFAANLSNQDIADLAAWFSKQEGLKDLESN
jgi:cytochrome c553